MWMAVQRYPQLAIGDEWLWVMDGCSIILLLGRKGARFLRDSVF